MPGVERYNITRGIRMMDDAKKAKIGKIIKHVLLAITILIIICIIVFLSIYLPYRAHHPQTKDAYVHGNVVGIAPQVSGQVSHVYVRNLQQVSKGQLLFELDPRPFMIAVQRAKADLSLAEIQAQAAQVEIDTARKQLAEKQSNLENVASETHRTLALAAKQFASRQDAITAKTNLVIAKAQVEAAESALEKAIINAGQKGDNNATVKRARAILHEDELNLSYTKIYAPEAGSLIKVSLRPGNWVETGIQQFSLIENQGWWIRANYKETQLEDFKVGMPATAVLDLYPHHTFHGVVASIARGSGASFSLLPPEDASGNWVKVTRRFPVEILLIHPDPKFPLRIGASVTVKVDTTAKLIKVPSHD